MDTAPRFDGTSPEHHGLDPAADGYGRAVGWDAAVLAVSACIIRLEQGLYSLSIGPIGSVLDAPPELSVPCLQLVSPPSAALDPVEILTAWNDQGSWLDAEGGTVVVRSPLGGGVVLATLYGAVGAAPLSLSDFDIRRLDQPRPAVRGVLPTPELADAGEIPEAPAAVVPSPPPMRLPKTDPAEVDTEIALHVQRIGDCSFPGGVWCGNIGQKVQIEALGIRPLERIGEGDIEYKAFGPGGRETRWVTDGKLSGTRGRGIPLTGFAVRLAPHVSDRFDVIYQGAFFASGVTLPARNGEPCLPPLADDSLEAVNIRVVERTEG